MKDDKYRIFLMYIFRVIMAINLPKFALISQIFLKFYQFLVFSTFILPNVARLGCYMFFFKHLKQIAVIYVKKKLH